MLLCVLGFYIWLDWWWFLNSFLALNLLGEMMETLFKSIDTYCQIAVDKMKNEGLDF